MINAFAERHPARARSRFGVAKIETTQRYWRAVERKRLMERVKDLSWETRFEAVPDKAPSGLEPLYEALQASA